MAEPKEQRAAIEVETVEVSAVGRELRIEVPRDQVSEAFDVVVSNIVKTARIPGFRRGRVPRSIVRRRYTKEIESEVLESMVGPAVRTALERTDLTPIHRPVVTEVTLVEGESLRFTASFEIVPVIEPVDYRGVVLQVSDRKVEPADVDRELAAMRDRASTYEVVEPRPIAVGDYALAEIRTTIDGEERVQDDALLEVGGDDFHPDFTRSVTGMAPGDERTFKVTYAEDDQDPRAAGKEVEYLVRLREVKRKDSPQLDDEFAQDVSQFETLEALRGDLRVKLEGRLEQVVREHQEGQLQAALLPSVTVDMPNALVESEVERMLEEHVRALVHRGIDPRTAPIDWKVVRQRLREQAEGSVKWRLLLDAIARKERVSVSDVDLEGRLSMLAQQSERSIDFVRSKIEEDGRMEELRRSIRLKKTVDFLIENARMEGR